MNLRKLLLAAFGVWLAGSCNLVMIARSMGNDIPWFLIGEGFIGACVFCYIVYRKNRY